MFVKCVLASKEQVLLCLVEMQKLISVDIHNPFWLPSGSENSSVLMNYIKINLKTPYVQRFFISPLKQKKEEEEEKKKEKKPKKQWQSPSSEPEAKRRYFPAGIRISWRFLVMSMKWYLAKHNNSRFWCVYFCARCKAVWGPSISWWKTLVFHFCVWSFVELELKWHSIFPSPETLRKVIVCLHSSSECETGDYSYSS